MNEKINTTNETTEGLNVPSFFTETQTEDFKLGVANAITANVYFKGRKEALRKFAEENAKHPYNPNITRRGLRDEIQEHDADLKDLTDITNELMPSRELYDGKLLGPSHEEETNSPQ